MKVALVVLTGERSLCGSFNNNVLKKVETRMEELEQLGLQYTVISVGKKGNAYFQHRPYIPLERGLEVNDVPTVKDSQATCDLVYSLFVSEEVDKVELLYSAGALRPHHLDAAPHVPQGRDLCQGGWKRGTPRGRGGRRASRQGRGGAVSGWATITGGGRQAQIAGARLRD
ncbi:ATP synthase subunit gamma, chloroplastic [Zea mays]|uniref:F-ATPase gamma subunit n=1 Tax=Zea mays TaxID=4577 RepID=A0A3L6EXY8_MAIZE|nr:ATP synthase subunit gamma, chloroplastic [Zea mays]